MCDGPNTDFCPYDGLNDIDSDYICGDVDSCPYDTENDAEADGEDGKTRKEAFIEAPSAAEVTAALEALGAGDTMDLTAVSPSNADTSAAATIEDTAADSEESKDGGDASGGWFEAQQNAEAASKSEPDTSADGSTSNENDDETEPDK